MNVLIDAAAVAGEPDPDGWVERSVGDWLGVPGVTVGSNPGSLLVSLGQEEPEFGFGGYRVVVTRQQAQALAVALHVAVGRPLMLPPLTAVQRAWVVGMAAGWERERDRRRAGHPPPLALGYAEWARGRWGRRRTEMLRCLALAVGEWRREQEWGA